MFEYWLNPCRRIVTRIRTVLRLQYRTSLNLWHGQQLENYDLDLDWYEGQEKVDLSDYVSSGTWDIIACPGRNEVVTGGDGYRHAWITFTLKIRRKTLFYTVNLIIPCVLISFLSVCVFYLPADAGEKMTMCISILLAFAAYGTCITSPEHCIAMKIL